MLKEISSKKTDIIAFLLLAIMAVTAILSMKGAALTFDEKAHIPAGYSYLAKQDYRINPEHPPLIKDIPAIPLLFLNLNFPDDHPVWTQEESAPAWWVQFDLGNRFLYHSGNNPREIIFWSRLAMIGLLIFLGWLFFYWTKRKWGNTVGLGVLTLFTFSPTFLAHGRLVNTDVGAVLGALIAVIFWLKFLQLPSWKNVFLAGIGFGIAMTFKFSLVLLIPFFVIITLLHAVLFPEKDKILKSIIGYSGKAILAAVIGVIFVIWPVYQFHIWNYPAERQLRDTIADISNHPVPIARDITFWMTEQGPLRGLAQYARGLLMASQRTAWGNTATFMGEIAADSWLHYFPALYLFKIPLAFHVLSLIVLIGAIWGIKKLTKEKRFLFWLKNNFIIMAILVWILVYWLGALIGNLNIGIRHLLPVFPFTYIIVVLGAVKLISLITSPKLKKTAAILVFALFAWYISSSLSTFPHYIPYYNELAGGTKEGHKIAVDSNYDWGQDFYRLLHFIENPPDGGKIEKIHLDYFGGEDLTYWLGEKYVRLNPREVAKDLSKGLTLDQAGGGIEEWVAVSVNQLQGGITRPVRDFDQETGYYNWLQEYTPLARVGHSIFIYKIENKVPITD